MRDRQRSKKQHRDIHTLSRMLLGLFAMCLWFFVATSSEAAGTLVKSGETTGTPQYGIGNYQTAPKNKSAEAWTIVENVPSRITVYTVSQKQMMNLSFWSPKNQILGVGDYAGKVWNNPEEAKADGFLSRVHTLMPEEGYHLYRVDRKKTTIDLMGWECLWPQANCSHWGGIYNTSEENWHDMYRYGSRCQSCYYSGWVPICADCGDYLFMMYHYITPSHAKQISAIDTTLDYYYQCPWCNGLEQGTPYPTHRCTLFSPNMYIVEYNANASDAVKNSITNDRFLYQNLTEYEGQELDDVPTRLTKVIDNTSSMNDRLTRPGYRFKCWNTKADGSGVNIPDGYAMPDNPDENLLGDVCKEQYDPTTGKGKITLYAVWEPFGVNVKLNMQGGTYDGTPDPTILAGYGEEVELEKGKVEGPKNIKVMYRDNNGTTVMADDTYIPMKFAGWERDPSLLLHLLFT